MSKIEKVLSIGFVCKTVLREFNDFTYLEVKKLEIIPIKHS